MFGKSKDDTDSPYAWFWKGKSAKKHSKDHLTMAPPFQMPGLSSNNGPGRGRLRLSIPEGLPIVRRQGGTNPYGNRPGPGFWSGENLHRQRLGGGGPQCRPRAISPSPESPPPCCSPAPRLRPELSPRRLRDIGRLPRGPRLNLPARFHRDGPRGRPFTREEYPGRFPASRSPNHDFGLHGRQRPVFVMPSPELDGGYYDIDSDGDTVTDLDDSDSETYTGGRGPLYPRRHRPRHRRYGGRRGHQESDSDDDDALSAFQSEDFELRPRRRGRFNHLDPADDFDFDGRGRRRRRNHFDRDFHRARASSSESLLHHWDL